MSKSPEDMSETSIFPEAFLKYISEFTWRVRVKNAGNKIVTAYGHF